MRVRTPILLLLAVVLLAVPPALSARRAREGRVALEAATASLANVRADAGRVWALRSLQERVAEQQRPEQDVITRVNAALEASGLPADRFVSVRLDSDAPVPRVVQVSGTGIPLKYRRQAMRVSLRELTVPELGAFLTTWARDERLWVPAQIELIHAGGRRGGTGSTAGTVGTVGTYSVALVIAATYIGGS